MISGGEEIFFRSSFWASSTPKRCALIGKGVLCCVWAKLHDMYEQIFEGTRFSLIVNSENWLSVKILSIQYLLRIILKHSRHNTELGSLVGNICWLQTSEYSHGYTLVWADSMQVWPPKVPWAVGNKTSSLQEQVAYILRQQMICCLSAIK